MLGEGQGRPAFAQPLGPRDHKDGTLMAQPQVLGQSVDLPPGSWSAWACRWWKQG